MITATDVYVVFNGNHTLESELGAPIAMDEDTQDSYRLDTDTLYAIICGGKRWDVVFQRWYGVFAIFSCPMRDNVHAVRHAHLRTLVKKVNAATQICQFPCSCYNPNDCSHDDDCTACDQPAVIFSDGLHMCRKHYAYNHACVLRSNPVCRDADCSICNKEDDRTFYGDGKPVPTYGTEG
jgi:hypothetical protein